MTNNYNKTALTLLRILVGVYLLTNESMYCAAVSSVAASSASSGNSNTSSTNQAQTNDPNEDVWLNNNNIPQAVIVINGNGAIDLTASVAANVSSNMQKQANSVTYFANQIG